MSAAIQERYTDRKSNRSREQERKTSMSVRIHLMGVIVTTWVNNQGGIVRFLAMIGLVSPSGPYRRRFGDNQARHLREDRASENLEQQVTRARA